MAFPTWLERRHIHNDSAACIGRFAKADDQHIARHAEILDRACQSKAVGRDDADVGLAVDKAFRVELFGVDHRAVDVGKNLELVGDAGVIAIRRQAIADASVAALRLDKGFNHGVSFGLFADPDVGKDGHIFFLFQIGRAEGMRQKL